MSDKNKKAMEGLQKGFHSAGWETDPLVKAIKERKKQVVEKVSGWFSDKEEKDKAPPSQ